MDQGGSTPENEAVERIVLAVIAERDGRATPHAELEAEAYLEVAAAVGVVRRDGSIDRMLRVERAALEVDLAHLGNTAEKRRSTGRAIEQCDRAIAMLPRVRNQEWYRAFNEGLEDPTLRKNGVPVDSARVFFESHRARLRNVASAGGTDAKMRSVAERRKMNDAAERIYRRLQMVALGLRRSSAGRGGAALER